MARRDKELRREERTEGEKSKKKRDRNVIGSHSTTECQGGGVRSGKESTGGGLGAREGGGGRELEAEVGRGRVGGGRTDLGEEWSNIFSLVGFLESLREVEFEDGSVGDASRWLLGRPAKLLPGTDLNE